MKVTNAKQIDMNFEKMINDAAESRELAQIIKTSWSLSSIPVISNIKCVKHAYDPKNGQDNTVVISASLEGIKSVEGQYFDSTAAQQVVGMVDVEMRKMVVKELRNSIRIDMNANGPSMMQSMLNNGSAAGQDGDDDHEDMYQPTYAHNMATARPFDENETQRDYIGNQSKLDTLDQMVVIDGEVVDEINATPNVYEE